jgi:hypothetical protein
MAATTKLFVITSAVYVDVSEGAESCAFRLHRNDAVRVVLGSVLPAANSVNYDTYIGSGSAEAREPAQFNELVASDRVYVRAEASNVNLVAYRI